MSSVGGTAPYIRRLADLLGLRDWRFRVLDEPCSEDYDAYVTMVAGQKLALVELGPLFPTESREARRYTVVHELLHCHFHEVQAVVERNVSGKVLRTEHKNFIEHGVDAVAVVLAPFMPLQEDT
jgi:hypothetical protein